MLPRIVTPSIEHLSAYLAGLTFSPDCLHLFAVELPGLNYRLAVDTALQPARFQLMNEDFTPCANLLPNIATAPDGTNSALSQDHAGAS